MNFHTSTSIKNKLTYVILLTSTILLVIASITMLGVELAASRNALNQEVRTLASTLAANSNRLLVLEKYHDIKNLLTSLERQQNIHAAYVFDVNGKPIAEYRNTLRAEFILSAVAHDFADQDNPWLQEREHSEFSFKHFCYFIPVRYEGSMVGSIYLLSDLDALYARLWGGLWGTLVAFILLLFCSLLLARWLQKPISMPLLQLADLMGAISESKQYSLRAKKVSRDEIGQLVDGFNHMLEEIEVQQGKLERHRQQLEQTVAERTAELRETVDELEKAKDLADSANRAKSDFLSKMTHELRTPLIGVLGMNELLQRTGLDEQQRILTQTVQTSGEELLELISGVLDLSKIEAGKLTLEPKAVELYRIVENVVHLLAPKVREKGLRLILDIPVSAAWKVRADEGRIRQIAMNLVGNALKFTTSGSIAVSLECVEEDEGEGLFVLRVADTGCGMSDEVQTHILETFYQSDNSGTRENSGAGLGLAIVHQLAELMNGQLSCISEPEKGSVFEFRGRFPLLNKQEFVLPEGLAEAPVLVCTEDINAGRLLSSRLTELGLSVEFVSAGNDAFYLYHSALRKGMPYRIVFAAAYMTLADGRLLCQALRANGDPSPGKIILLCEGQDAWPMFGSDINRLQLPINLNGLHEELCRCWSTLRLVSSVPAAEMDITPGTIAPKVLLMGRNVAGRELLRLMLRKYPLDITAVNGPGVAQEYLAAHDFSALFIDEPQADDAWLNDFIAANRQRFEMIVALTSERRNNESSTIYHRYLKKPLDEMDLSEVVTALVEHDVQDVSEGGQ